MRQHDFAIFLAILAVFAVILVAVTKARAKKKRVFFKEKLIGYFDSGASFSVDGLILEIERQTGTVFDRSELVPMLERLVSERKLARRVINLGPLLVSASINSSVPTRVALYSRAK